MTDETNRTDSQVVTIDVAGSCAPIRHFLNDVSPTPTWDETYHVDGSVTSNGNGSEGSPFKTIDAALEAVKVLCANEGTAPECEETGVRVLIRNTVAYDDPISVTSLRGTAAAPIWIGGDLHAEPVLSDNQDDGDAHEILKLSKPAYVILENMILGRNVGHTRDHAINIDDGGSSNHNDFTAAHHVIIRNLYFKNIGDGFGRINPDNGDKYALHNCIKPSGLNHFWILENRFDFCGMGRSDEGAPSPTATSRGGYGVNADGCHDGVIANNHFTGRTFTLTKGGSRNIDVRQNTSWVQLRVGSNPNDNATNDDNRNSYQVGGSMSAGGFRPSLSYPGDHYEARHIRLTGNVITGGLGIRIEGCNECLVANNTVIDPTSWLFQITQPHIGESDEEDFAAINRFASDGQIFNNIFYHSKAIPKVVRSASITNSQWTSFKFRSNLSCNRLSNDCTPLTFTLPDGADNSGWLEGTQCSGSCDPQFVPLSSYFLGPESPAKASGSPLGDALELTGYVPPPDHELLAEDRGGVCFDDTLPSRGAREAQ